MDLWHFYGGICCFVLTHLSLTSYQSKCGLAESHRTLTYFFRLSNRWNNTYGHAGRSNRKRKSLVVKQSDYTGIGLILKSLARNEYVFHGLEVIENWSNSDSCPRNPTGRIKALPNADSKSPPETSVDYSKLSLSGLLQ